MSGPRLRSYLKTLDSRRRVALLHALQTRGALTVDQLATATGLHPNTTREHLHRLVEVGLVRAEPVLRGRRGRPALRYLPTVPDPRTGPDAVPRATQLEALNTHMARCGFDATVDPSAGRMTMRDCPFARMSEGDPQVCQVHRALIEATLERVPGPLRAGELQRGDGGRICTLELPRIRNI